MRDMTLQDDFTIYYGRLAQLTLPTRKIKYLPRRGSIADALHANKTKYYGRLAQLVAHLNDIQRVTSSSLVSPTIKRG